MLEEKGKRYFTQTEMREIISLVNQKEKADTSKKKTIRAKIRRKGLQWKELVGETMTLTLDNLKKVIELGIIKVEGIEVDSSPISENSSSASMKMRANEGTVYENSPIQVAAKGRKGSDEHYVIDLCDEILGRKASRQHRFEFLKGDTGVSLPVDAYYPELDLVIEYYESQHTESTPFFDKKQTVSGVSRGEQRRIYDQRRRTVLPEHGIRLVVISYKDFGFCKKLKRNPPFDRGIIISILTKEGIIK